MPQESKLTVRKPEFAQVIAEHFIRNHITNKDYRHIPSITSQNGTLFQIIAIGFKYQTNNEHKNIYNFQVVEFEPDILVQVFFLPSTTQPSTTQPYQQVPQYDCEFFYLASTISEQSSKEICKQYIRDSNKIPFAYRVVIDDAGKAIAINPCYQSKITNFFSLELPTGSRSHRQNNPSKDEPSRSCILM